MSFPCTEEFWPCYAHVGLMKCQGGNIGIGFVEDGLTLVPRGVADNHHTDDVGPAEDLFDLMIV